MKKMTRALATVSCLTSVWGCMGTSDPLTTEGLPADEQVSVEVSALFAGSALPIDYPFTCDSVFSPKTWCTVKQAGGTNYTTLHCCPIGYAMQALRAEDTQTDALYCRSVPYIQETGGDPNSNRDNCYWRSQSISINGGLAVNGCGTSEYMIGINQGLNRIACCPTGAPTTNYYDGPGYPAFHQTANQYPVKYSCDGSGCDYCNAFTTMHSCGDVSGSQPTTPLMRGINLAQNVWLCVQ
jgi:hypothetical protein